MRQLGQYRVEGTYLRGPRRVHLAQPPGDGPAVLIVEERVVPGTPAPDFRHPNLPTVLEVEQVRETRYTVLELPRGMPLSRLVAERGPLPEEAALAIAVQVAAALEHLHRQPQPVVLGYLSPRWVRVDESGRAVVNFLAVEPGLTAAGTGHVEPGFVAPEAEGGAPTIRSDVYSLGMVLAVLTGLTSPTRRRIRGGLLASAIDQAVDRDPRQRYEGCMAFRAALEQIQAELALRRALDAGHLAGGVAPAAPALPAGAGGAEPGAAGERVEPAGDALATGHPVEAPVGEMGGELGGATGPAGAGQGTAKARARRRARQAAESDGGQRPPDRAGQPAPAGSGAAPVVPGAAAPPDPAAPMPVDPAPAPHGPAAALSDQAAGLSAPAAGAHPAGKGRRSRKAAAAGGPALSGEASGAVPGEASGTEGAASVLSSSPAPPGGAGAAEGATAPAAAAAAPEGAAGPEAVPVEAPAAPGATAVVPAAAAVPATPAAGSRGRGGARGQGRAREGGRSGDAESASPPHGAAPEGRSRQAGRTAQDGRRPRAGEGDPEAGRPTTSGARRGEGARGEGRSGGRRKAAGRGALAGVQRLACALGDGWRRVRDRAAPGLKRLACALQAREKMRKQPGGVGCPPRSQRREPRPLQAPPGTALTVLTFIAVILLGLVAYRYWQLFGP